MDTVVKVESLNHEGDGVARAAGKTVFIEGALPYETVCYTRYHKKANFDKGRMSALLQESFIRTTPSCPHFGICGGCTMQHIDSSAQVAIKQRLLEDSFVHIAKIKPITILPPIYGIKWAYRQRARLSVRYVAKKQSVLVGFHEKRSSFVADIQSCSILPADIAALIMPLRALINALSIYDRLPQIEVAVGESVNVLVLRILAPLSQEDIVLIQQFSDRYGVQIWLQSHGPETAYPFYPASAAPLYYSLPEFGITIHFHPTEFTQVNARANQALIKRALTLLDPQPNDVIMDMFCGLGNFTLPIASCGSKVLGIEGNRLLVQRARDNANDNGLSHLAQFKEADLFKISAAFFEQFGCVNKMLLDPPRDGAMALVKALPYPGPQRIVYVSCNPATMARDAGILVHEKGYMLQAAAIVNMFAQTRHVESIALFEKTLPG